MKIAISKCARWCFTAFLVFIIGFATGIMFCKNPGKQLASSQKTITEYNSIIDSLEDIIDDNEEYIEELRGYDDDDDDDDDDYSYED